MPFRLRLERTQKINCFQKGNEKKDTRHAVHCSQKRRRGKSNIPRASAAARTRRKERKFLSNNKIRELVREKRKKKIRQRMMKGVGLDRLYHG
jgi:hypothetical protein